MAIRDEDLIRLIGSLSDKAKQSAYDYLTFLAFQVNRPDWDEIERMEPVDEPLSEEEEQQLKANSGYLSWEEAMRELNLPTDIKP